MAKVPDTPRRTVLKSSDMSLTSALSSRSSTFRSLISSKSTKEKSLPKFLRSTSFPPPQLSTLPFGPSASTPPVSSLHNVEEMNLLTSHFTIPSSRSLFTQMAPPKPFRMSRDLATEILRKKLEKIEEILVGIREEEKGDPQEVLLSVKEMRFTREEVRRLVCEGEVTRKTMQAYFKHLNHENRKTLDLRSVKVFSPAFTQEIFGKGHATSLHSTSDPLKYE